MTDVAASLEGVRVPLTDIAMRSLDLEKYLWVDEFAEVSSTTLLMCACTHRASHECGLCAQVAKDVVEYTKQTEQKLVR